jgi:hypothetical protein
MQTLKGDIMRDSISRYERLGITPPPPLWVQIVGGLAALIALYVWVVIFLSM